MVECFLAKENVAGSTPVVRFLVAPKGACFKKHVSFWIVEADSSPKVGLPAPKARFSV